MSAAEGEDAVLVEFQMPSIHDAASDASMRAQNTYLRWSRTRLISLVAAAGCAAASSIETDINIAGFLVVCAFLIAGVSEIVLLVTQPERDWYSGRAIAESVKTLVWRFSVGGEPFSTALNIAHAENLLLERVREVLTKGGDKLDLSPGPAVVTDGMRLLRGSPLDVRRKSYLKLRTEDQQSWYSAKAKSNAVRAKYGRIALLIGEFLAFGAAGFALYADLKFDFAGIVAALVASLAAWIAIKQYSQITSAYRIAAAELAIQQTTLATIDSQKWAQAVADAEEAISREHTMWLASRGQEPLPRQ